MSEINLRSRWEHITEHKGTEVAKFRGASASSPPRAVADSHQFVVYSLKNRSSMRVLSKKDQKSSSFEKHKSEVSSAQFVTYRSSVVASFSQTELLIWYVEDNLTTVVCFATDLQIRSLSWILDPLLNTSERLFPSLLFVHKDKAAIWKLPLMRRLQKEEDPQTLTDSELTELPKKLEDSSPGLCTCGGGQLAYTVTETAVVTFTQTHHSTPMWKCCGQNRIEDIVLFESMPVLAAMCQSFVCVWDVSGEPRQLYRLTHSPPLIKMSRTASGLLLCAKEQALVAFLNFNSSESSRTPTDPKMSTYALQAPLRRNAFYVNQMDDGAVSLLADFGECLCYEFLMEPTTALSVTADEAEATVPSSRPQPTTVHTTTTQPQQQQQQHASPPKAVDLLSMLSTSSGGTVNAQSSSGAGQPRPVAIGQNSPPPLYEETLLSTLPQQQQQRTAPPAAGAAAAFGQPQGQRPPPPPPPLPPQTTSPNPLASAFAQPKVVMPTSEAPPSYSLKNPALPRSKQPPQNSPSVESTDAIYAEIDKLRRELNFSVENTKQILQMSARSILSDHDKLTEDAIEDITSAAVRSAAQAESTSNPAEIVDRLFHMFMEKCAAPCVRSLDAAIGETFDAQMEVIIRAAFERHMKRDNSQQLREILDEVLKDVSQGFVKEYESRHKQRLDILQKRLNEVTSEFSRVIQQLYEIIDKQQAALQATLDTGLQQKIKSLQEELNKVKEKIAASGVQSVAGGQGGPAAAYSEGSGGISVETVISQGQQRLHSGDFAGCLTWITNFESPEATVELLCDTDSELIERMIDDPQIDDTVWSRVTMKLSQSPRPERVIAVAELVVKILLERNGLGKNQTLVDAIRGFAAHWKSHKASTPAMKKALSPIQVILS